MGVGSYNGAHNLDIQQVFKGVAPVGNKSLHDPTPFKCLLNYHSIKHESKVNNLGSLKNWNYCLSNCESLADRWNNFVQCWLPAMNKLQMDPLLSNTMKNRAYPVSRQNAD